MDICNLTLSVGGLATASYKNPTWLPTYPKDKSFKLGTYFPFSIVIPVKAGSASSYNYPPVDVIRGFYACDAALRALPEDQVVPAPGKGKASPTADDDGPSSQSTTGGFGSKIKWSGFLSAAKSDPDCISACLAKLNQQKDDCAGKQADKRASARHESSSSPPLLPYLLLLCQWIGSSILLTN